MAWSESTGTPLVLASASPRRRELLETLGVVFTCDPAAVDETPLPGESPAEYVARVARAKALAVRARHTGRCAVLAADTAVVLGGRIFGKPADRAEALAMLRRLSGQVHRVLTAVAVYGPGIARLQSVATEVTFTGLSEAAREAYVDSGECCDKAGAYAIQGLGGAFVRSIRGSYSNVVGLPLAETRALLQAAGVPTQLDPAPAPGAGAS